MITSDPVQVRRIFNVDFVIMEVNLYRPKARNTIGSAMLRRLRNTFETLETDDESNVVMISISIPKVFCTGSYMKGFNLIFDSGSVLSLSDCVLFSHAKFICTDEATTCVGLIIRNQKNRMISVSHIDSLTVVSTGLEQMLSQVVVDSSDADFDVLVFLTFSFQ
ncbi:Protein N-terminal asparagine amidohydrolase [Linum perenne]